MPKTSERLPITSHNMGLCTITFPFGTATPATPFRFLNY